jgi:hypothetical protein
VSNGYSYAVDAAVLTRFGQCSRREREQLLRAFEFLAQVPHQRGEWVRRTPSARELQLKRFGKWLVTYWPDHAVREVRIVDVERVIP